MKSVMHIFLLVGALALVSCQGTVDNSKNKTSHPHLNKVDRSGPEYTSTYICPMHCPTSGSDTMGTCPICKMDYVLNESK